MKKPVFCVVLLLGALLLSSCAGDKEKVLAATKIAINHLEFAKIKALEECAEQGIVVCENADKFGEWITTLNTVRGYVENEQFDDIEVVVVTIVSEMVDCDIDEGVIVYVRDIKIILDAMTQKTTE